MPRTIYARPFYGPAFVGFLGGGSASESASDLAAARLVPAGLGEPYRPWYHAGGAYWRNREMFTTLYSQRNT